jgi:hypothetical protein
MDITNAKTARAYVRAWTGHSGARHMVTRAAADQSVCARLSRNDRERNGHLAAAAVLNAAAQRLAETAR